MSYQKQLACPSCDTSFEPAQYGGFCPDCYAPHPEYDHNEVDSAEQATGRTDGGSSLVDDSADPDADLTGTSDSVTLVFNGESYTMEDGDTFGRRSAGGWLQDLIAVAGGKDAVAYISGEHLEFSSEDDGVYVEDVSTNGTRLNDDDISGERAKLEDGDTLTLADRADITVEL